MKLRVKPVVRGLAVAFGGLTIVPAYAQAPQVQEEVVVTGTRIRTPGAVSISPISSVTAEEIRQTQPVAVEEFFKQLPAAAPAIGSGTNNGTGGGATIDLRGLSGGGGGTVTNRSLVLVDGRRFVPFDLFGQVDTNSIPMALLQRVDVITGGASAVYGADAVAGVANFILRRDFKGFEVDTSYGKSHQSDAGRSRTDVTMGAGFDDGRGNVALSMGWTNVQPLRQDRRGLGTVSRSSASGAPQGSGTAVPVVVFLPDSQQIDLTTGAFRPTYASYNFNPDNYYQTALDRNQLTALGSYTINNHAEVYARLFYTRSDVISNLAPSGSFFNDYSVPVGNPYIPNAARQQICAFGGVAAADCVVGNPTEVLLSLGRRFVELGPRLNNFENKTHQTTLGVRGDLVGSWTYDAYWSQGKSDQVQTRGNWGSFAKVQQALRALSTAECIDPSNGCVPLNIFGPDGSISKEMLDFINLDAVLLQKVEMKNLAASVSGDLGAFRSPLSKAPIGVALGVEYREDKAANKSDGPSQIQGEVLGTGAPTPDRSGKVELKEIFGELSVPLITDMPFAKKLSLELGYRHTDFKTTSSQNYGSYKYGGDWEPIDGFRIRATAQRATRSPNINELYAPLVSGLSNLDEDPCQGTNVNQAQANTPGTLSNLCRLTGVPLNAIGQLPAPSAGQINVQTGGNPNLGPEKADTKTLGFVWQPAFVRGLTMSVDYYTIKLKDAVSNPSETDILEDCYNATRNPGLVFNAACGQVLRNPNNGTFNGSAAPGVVLPLSNLGRLETKGWDVGITYGLPLRDLGLSPALGRLDISFNGNFVESWKFQATPASVNRDCLGYYSIACGSNGPSPNPKRKWSQRTAWTVGDFMFSYNWRHISAVEEEPGGTNFLPAYSRIGAFDYFDLGAVWNYNKNIRIALSIANVGDKKPPQVGNTIGQTSQNSGNTFPQTYDVIGRFYTLGATIRF